MIVPGVSVMEFANTNFAVSDFKYRRHLEITSGTRLDGFGFIDSTALLNADDRRYAAYPDGIPDKTPFGTFLCYSLVAALTLGYLACQMGGFSPMRLFLKPVAATLFMVPVPLFLYPVLASRMPSSFATLVTLAFSVTVYLTVTALLKGIGREDLLSLGVPRKITVLLEKLRILS